MDFSMIFIVVFIAYIGSIISKLLFYASNLKKNEQINALFVAIPLSSIRAEKFLDSKKFKTNISLKKVVAIELLGIASFFTFTFSIMNLITRNIIPFPEAILIILLNLYFISYFLYFAIHDLIRLKLPNKEVRSFLLSILIISIIVGTYRFIFFRVSGEMTLLNVELGYLDNLIAGALLSLLVFIFIKFNKGFGYVDIELVFVLGLVLGFPDSFIALFFISIIGAIISVIYCLRIRKFKDVRVPFAQFLLIGYVLALGFGQNFIDFLQRL